MSEAKKQQQNTLVRKLGMFGVKVGHYFVPVIALRSTK